MPECTNCDLDLSDRQPLYLQKDAYVDRVRVGQFCTYECLAEYVRTNELADGVSDSTE